jgi:preprotein translocase subunit SecG
MITLLTIVHVIVSIFLILVVLLQQGKSADWSGAFGGSSQTSFGQRGTATVLTKATTACAVLFMLTSMALTILITSSTGGSSVIREGAQQEQTQPAEQPATPAPAQPATPPPATPEKQ